MSRYPSYEVARFDQQFRETEYERNARLRRVRLARAKACFDDGRGTGASPEASEPKPQHEAEKKAGK